MTEAIFSAFWYRVAELKPKLRHQVRFHRHEYRGEIWYALEDASSGRYHRFGLSAYQIIGRMDGERCLNDIWDSLNSRLDDEVPSQDEIIQLLGQLHAADLLLCDVPADAEEVLLRNSERKLGKLKSRLVNPVAQRIPLWDPNRFLGHISPWFRWLNHWTIALAIIALLVVSLMQAGVHWHELNHHILTRSLEPYNLLALCLIYPLVKWLHELGHGIAAKLGGGEIHEMGIMFLLFLPIPYIDVSCSTAFHSKYQRMMVSAAGIVVELVLASLALLLWIQLQPGFFRDVAFNVVLIGSVSSLLFNGNPLLRYDGYYVLSDAIAIPNLYQRASQYMYYLCQRYLFGVNVSVSPATAQGEAGWFFFYSIAAFIYRITLLWFIIWFVVDKAFFLGIVLALWLLAAQIAMPIFKGIRFVLADSRIDQQRIRALTVSSSLLLIIGLCLFVVPAPSSTHAMGVVDIPEDAQLKAGVDGFLSDLIAAPNKTVSANEPIIRIEDVLLPARVDILKARVREVKARYTAYRVTDRVQAEIVKEELVRAQADLDFALDDLDATTLRSPKQGDLVIFSPEDLPGRFVKKGDLIGYVLSASKSPARVIVNQNDIGRVQQGVTAVEVRLPGNMGVALDAKVIRQYPEATDLLPAAALATINGGPIVVDPGQPDELRALEKFFQVDLEILNDAVKVPIGSRVYVRFYHSSEPVAYQWYRSLRQLFLKNIEV